MSLSADEILACTTPHELFGDAVHDRRGLKRAYAGLIKVWGPDAHPEVFRHIRGLYEAAKRDSAPELEPERPTLRLVSDEPEPEPDAPPAERLRAAMEGGDADGALEVLEAHDLDLRIDHPGLWFASVATLADLRTFSLPAEVLQSWLDAIDGAPVTIPATILDRIELLSGTGVAYQAARQDEAIEPALLDLLALWGEDAVTVAEGFIALGEALPDDEAARAAHETLKVRYPGLWFPYSLLRNQVTREVDSYDESQAGALEEESPEWLATWADPKRNFPLWAVLAVAGMMSVPFLAPYWGSTPTTVEVGIPHALAAIAIVGFAVWEYARGSIRHVPRDDHPQVASRLIVQARLQTVFPHEALDLALRDRSHSPPATLLRWQQDPTTLLRILTPAHLDRIRARDAQPAETE